MALHRPARRRHLAGHVRVPRSSRHARASSEGSRITGVRPKMALRSRSRRAALALALLVFGVISPVTASVTSAAGTTKPEIRLSGEAARRLLSAYDHTYKLRETVPLYANKVGPFHNPSEVRRARSPDPRSQSAFIGSIVLATTANATLSDSTAPDCSPPIPEPPIRRRTSTTTCRSASPWTAR